MSTTTPYFPRKKRKNKMDVIEICQKAKYASQSFAAASTAKKNAVLAKLKELILANKDKILEANALDIERAREAGRGSAFLDRLALNESRINLMAESLDDVIALRDPVGEVVERYTRPNGLKVKRVRAPLGVIGIIFEARPNVAVDAASLCIKSGNGVILRGSRESASSVNYLVSLIKDALKGCGLNENIVGNVDPMDRELTAVMLRQDKYIDVVIPRGGEALKKVVLENATMPVIASAGGNCHMYIAKSADIPMAVSLVVNAKCNRPSTCNALETLLIDRAHGKETVVALLKALKDNKVELRGTQEVADIAGGLDLIVGEEEFGKEYDDLIIKIKMVSGVKEAIDHINLYGTRHSDAIVTNNQKEARRFTQEVDSAAVYVNVSTRFTDGFELGLGAEMGISTQKLHVRGPIGLRELTSVKYVVTGEGQLRK
jgi:glutamate-5-semialdehyde dehydrogenase